MMFDAKRLLDQFLGGQNDPGSRQQQSAAPWGDLARGAGDALSRGGGLGGVLGGFGGGALAGGLASVLLGSKQGRKLAGNVVTLGGMAVVGALAYQAYRSWQTGQALQPGAQAPVAMLPPPSNTPFNPVTEADQQSLSRNLLRAMIGAAKADGHVDAAEQANVFAQMDKMALSAEDKAFVIDELRKPLDIDAVARGARTPEEAAEIYVASLLAIDVDNPSERGYLDMLAARLKLDAKLVAHLHATVEGATEKVAASG